MAEEEQSFTFMDKRRGADAEVGETPTSSSEQASEFSEQTPEFSEHDLEDADSEDGGAQPSLDVYSLLAYCVSLLERQAWQALGLMADPQTGEARPDMAQAKVAIDAVGDLAKHLDGATADALPDDLRRDLRTMVSNLRLNYVGQQSRTP